MHRSVRRLLVTPALLLGTVGCTSDAVAPRHAVAKSAEAEGGSTLAIAPNDPNATSVFIGTVVGKRTNGDTTVVGGALIKVFEWHPGDPSHTDSLGSAHMDSVGTLVSAPDGTFRLSSLPVADFDIGAFPPAGSPFQHTYYWTSIWPNSTTTQSIDVWAQ